MTEERRSELPLKFLALFILCFFAGGGGGEGHLTSVIHFSLENKKHREEEVFHVPQSWHLAGQF